MTTKQKAQYAIYQESMSNLAMSATETYNEILTLEDMTEDDGVDLHSMPVWKDLLKLKKACALFKVEIKEVKA